MSASAERSRHPRSGALLLVAAILLAYAPVISQGGFVWDDERHVVGNPALRSFDGLRALWADASVTPQYYPLTHTSFWLEYQLWGDAPRGYHAVNVVLHALAALLLWRILRDLGLPGAWFAAAVWALHPIQVESVAWISERKNVLSGLFFLVSLMCWIRAFGLAERRTAGTAGGPGAGECSAERSGGTAAGRGSAYAAAGALAYVSALLSKTVTSVLPVSLAVLIWWRGCRPTRRQWIHIGAMLVAGAMMGALTSWLERNQVGASGPEWSHGAFERLAIAGRVWWFYLGKLVFPLNLTFIYPRWDVERISGAWMAWPVAALTVLLVLHATRHRIGRGPLAAALHYSVALVPALGLFNVYPMRYAFVADHFQYLAGIGPLVALSVAAVSLAARLPRRITVPAAATLLIALSVTSWNRAGVFESREALWRDTLQRNPAAWIAHNNLGILDAEAGRAAAAERHFLRVVELKPDHAGARNNLGWLWLRAGRAELAVEQLRAAVALDPAAASSWVNLGEAQRASGDERGAEQSYRQALRIEPLDARALGALVDLMLRQRRPEETLELLGGLLRRGAEGADLRYGYGRVLLLQGQPREAMRQFEQALRLRPGFAAAARGLADAREAAAR